MVGLWKQHQRRVGYPFGECVRTSYASLLNLPIDAVPNFAPGVLKGEPQAHAEQRWLRTLGLDLIVVRQDGGEPKPKIPPTMYHLISVMTPLHHEHGHRVVGRGGKLVHDPHPGGVPITRIKAYYFVVPRAWTR